MIKALSTAATGMEAQETRLDVTANNIANVSTAGFKKGRAEFQDLMYQQLRASGAPTGASTRAPSGLEVGSGVRVAATMRQHSEGDLKQTGNPLDLAIEGNGFFQVALPNGQTAYTRDGSFKLSAEGKIVTSDGYSLTTDISVPPDAQSITVGVDGTVSATTASETTPVELGKIQLANFANPAGLTQLGRNLFRETASSGSPITADPGQEGVGTISQGTLELSNVKVVEEMIDLIAGQRAYEVNSRVIKAADDMLGQTANLR
jgi:flagellar basal-body rod protein FlgG